jgi:hypothetical protein
VFPPLKQNLGSHGGNSCDTMAHNTAEKIVPPCDKSISCGENCVDKECDSSTVKSELQLLGLKIMTFSVILHFVDHASCNDSW